LKVNNSIPLMTNIRKSSTFIAQLINIISPFNFVTIPKIVLHIHSITD
jgi:hypothetical protein